MTANDRTGPALAQARLIFFPRDTVAPQNHPEAEQLIHSASAILDSSLPPSLPFIANTVRGLRRLYGSEAMNDPDKPAEIQARLDTLDGGVASRAARI